MAKGLVSKWASDDDLKPKDGGIQETKHGNLLSGPITSRLESKWASDDGDEIPHISSKLKPVRARRYSRGHKLHPSHGHDKHRHSSLRKGSDGDVQAVPQQLQTPPSSRDSAGKDSPRQDGDQKEHLVPMSQAAKSFAARLGSNDLDHHHQTHGVDKDYHNDEQLDYNSDSDEERPQMTTGNALAARLGLAGKPDIKKSKPEARNRQERRSKHEASNKHEAKSRNETRSRHEPSHKSQGFNRHEGHKQQGVTRNESSRHEGFKNSSNNHDSALKHEDSKYIPPKQKRLMEQKAQAEKAAQLKAQQEEIERQKYKAEVDKLVKEMENSNISWADMDD